MGLPRGITKQDYETLKALPADEVEKGIAVLLAQKRKRHAAHQRAYRERHPDRVRASATSFRSRHRQAVNEERKLYNKEHPEKRQAERQRRREQDAAYKAAWKKRNPEMDRASRRRGRSRKKAAKLLSDKPFEVRKMIQQQLPGYLDASARADILADVCVSITSREVLFEDLDTCAKPFVAAYNRKFDHFKNLSLDAPMPGSDKGETWVSRLVDPSTVQDD